MKLLNRMCSSNFLFNILLSLLIFIGFESALFANQSANIQLREADPAWQKILSEARGQSVNFYAWAGDPNINAYLAWANKRLQESYGVTLNHVKISDTSEAVTLILAEAEQGKRSDHNGSVDLLWLNGQNFATLQDKQLLRKSWVEQLPNALWLNSENHPQLNSDFGLATEGAEAPWGQANFLFFYNSRVLKQADLPQDPAGLLVFTQRFPGRFTYSKPPDFLGVSFLKQLLIQLNPDDPRLAQAVDKATFEDITAPLWHYLDQLHPNLYRQGRYFSLNHLQLLARFDDEQLLLGTTFSGAGILAAKARYDLPSSTAIYAMQAGSLSNVHFLGIPANAKHASAAQVAADFLLSPEAQAKKQSMSIWGDKTVLDLNAYPELAEPFAGTFSDAMPVIEHPLAELPPSWAQALTDAWLARYGNAVNSQQKEEQ